MCARDECDNTEQGLRRLQQLRARSRVQVTVEFHIVLRAVSLDLGFHAVIGVGRLIVQRDGFYTSTAFHHAYVIPSAKFLSSGSCSQTLSCHRPLNLYPKFLHISHIENGSFEVVFIHHVSRPEMP